MVVIRFFPQQPFPESIPGRASGLAHALPLFRSVHQAVAKLTGGLPDNRGGRQTLDFE
jgi:hypothetical protein